MNLGLEGRTAVVGASSAGLGFATAKALADEGARVLLSGRDADRLEDAARRIGHRTSVTTADLSTPEGARALVAHALDEFERIDILVANVGGPPPGLAQNLETEQLRAAVDRCLFAMTELTQGVLPGMRRAGWGRILAITSGGVRQPLPGMVYSNATRTALTAYLKTLSTEVMGDGVTVNSILPGNQLTERLSTMLGDGAQDYFASLPAGRAGDASDFGRVAAFLCSEPANYLTGVALQVDGGADTGLF